MGLADVDAHPMLKWPGGKGGLLADLQPLLPPTHGRYHEPFVGGAALFFATRPREALLSDANADLIGTYEAVRDDVDGVVYELSAMRYVEAEFYSAREEFNARNASPARRAALMIYLNRTCFNGLFRVNRSGAFNVPFGRYVNPRICDAANLRACSAALAGVRLAARSCWESLELVRPGDFVYLDSPYAPVSATANFTAYTAEGFDERDQERLAREFRRLVDLGAYVLASNADVPAVCELYSEFRIVKTSRGGGMNCKASARGRVPEVIVTWERATKKAKRRRGEGAGASGAARRIDA